MFDKFTGIFEVLQKGKALANARAWTTGQITATALAGFLLLVIQYGQAWGIHVPAWVDTDFVNKFCDGFIVFVNLYFSVATSHDHGVGGVSPDGASGDSSGQF
jgi:hypothetical protein